MSTAHVGGTVIGSPSKPETDQTPRSVRVAFPVRVSFAGEKFQISDFTANLSTGGLFLLTENIVPKGTIGDLTFRVSQWEDPFTIQAEVVWCVPPGEEEDGEDACGIGVKFLNLSDDDAQRLDRVIGGIQDGSVTEAIRRSFQESNRTLLEELRRRSADQKVMFALAAKGSEIEALIRDGNPAAVQRLLNNPHLGVRHVQLMLRDTRVPPRVLLALLREQKWMADQEIKTLFCMHPNAPIQEVMNLLDKLQRQRLQQVEKNINLRAQVRMKARKLLSDRSRS